MLTNDIRNYVRSRPWPKNLDYDLYETLTEIRLVFFRDNWITLTPEEHIVTVALFKEVMEKIRNDGSPIVFNRFESRRG